MKLDPREYDFKNFNLDTIAPESGVDEIPDYVMVEKSDIAGERMTENVHLLELCYQYWSSLADFRDRRKTSRNYYRGDQWSEYITNPDNPNESITEEQHIINQGKLPLKQNVIRQVVKNLIGQYINNPSSTVVVPHDRAKAEEAEILTNAIRSVHNINRTSKLDTRNIEEFFLSGCAFQKITYQYWHTRNQEDVYIENCNPNRIFFNSDITDPRYFDVRLIGELYDLTINEVVSAFAKNEEEAKRIRNIYTYSKQQPIPSGKGLSTDIVDMQDFYLSYDPTLCRVIEVWQLKAEWRTYAHDLLDGSYNIVPYSMEQINQINQERIVYGASQGIPPEKIPLIEASRKFEEFWFAKYLTPWGHTLWEGETVYMHEEHPFSFVLYPLLDGEVWGFVEDIIDQQRYINRLITLMDFIIGFSAKGVLLVPEDTIPEGMSIDDFAEEWTKFNGVIKIKLKPGAEVPQQIVGRATNIGINEQLMLQFKLLEQISGVSPAMQGQQARSGTPSSLYAQEAQNATLNSKDYFETYNEFKKDRDTKVLKLIQQFYKDQRHIHISGASFQNAQMVYDPDRVRNLEAEVVVTESQDTPVYRQITDDIMFKLLEMQAINVEMFLENSSLPFADKLLTQFRNMRQQSMQQGIPQAGGPINPAMAQAAQAAQGQVQRAIDPNVLQMIEQLMAQGQS